MFHISWNKLTSYWPSISNIIPSHSIPRSRPRPHHHWKAFTYPSVSLFGIPSLIPYGITLFSALSYFILHLSWGSINAYLLFDHARSTYSEPWSLIRCPAGIHRTYTFCPLLHMTSLLSSYRHRHISYNEGSSANNGEESFQVIAKMAKQIILIERFRRGNGSLSC